MQLFSLNIRSKQRKQGGRRKVSAEDIAQSSLSSVDSVKLSDSGKTDTEEQKLGRYKYLCAPGDIEGVDIHY